MQKAFPRATWRCKRRREEGSERRRRGRCARNVNESIAEGKWIPLQDCRTNLLELFCDAVVRVSSDSSENNSDTGDGLAHLKRNELWIGLQEHSMLPCLDDQTLARPVLQRHHVPFHGAKCVVAFPPCGTLVATGVNEHQT
jgi:hypothetical protein